MVGAKEPGWKNSMAAICSATDKVFASSTTDHKRHLPIAIIRGVDLRNQLREICTVGSVRGLGRDNIALSNST